MELAFARAGITSARAVRAMGCDAAYDALLAHGSHKAHFIAYYALAMGLQGRPWNDCSGAEKARLRSRFDALCRARQSASDTTALDSLLDDIGVIAATSLRKEPR